MRRLTSAGARTAVLSLLLVAAAGRPDPSPGFRVLGYDLSLSLTAGSDSIAALQRVRALVTSSGLRALRLELRGLTVDSASVAGSPVDAARRGDTLVLALPGGSLPSRGDTIEAHVAYHGRPSDGLIAGPNVHGDWTVFADDWPERASYWFASVDAPSEKAAVTFRLDLPPGWTSVANGVRTVDRPLPGGRRRQVWVERRSIPVYTMVVGAGRLTVEDAGTARAGPGGAAVPISYVLFPEDSARGGQLFGRAADIVEAFARRFGPFPYAKLALVESATRYGGMENTSAIFFPQGPVSQGAIRETTVAHEITHQWFGDAVTEAEWRDLWLSEGFASFGEALWLEISKGPAAYRRHMEEFERSYLASGVADRPVLGPVPSDLTRLLDANAYQKGAWVLDMLRRRVGDEAFFAGLRRYYERYRGSAASTEDFRKVMEAVSGQDLSGFFRQWLRRPGYPSLLATWSPDGGSPGVRLRVCQRQGGPPYDLELPVRVYAADADTLVELRTDAERTGFDLPLAATPDSVRADPGDRILGPVRTERGDPSGACPAPSAG